MAIEAVFGVKSDNIEEARKLLEELLQMSGEARDSTDRGGGYYCFRVPPDERVYLMKNEDLYDGEPLYDEAVGWKIVLELQCEDAACDWVQSLESNGEHFVKLRSEVS